MTERSEVMCPQNPGVICPQRELVVRLCETPATSDDMGMETSVFVDAIDAVAMSDPSFDPKFDGMKKRAFLDENEDNAEHYGCDGDTADGNCPPMEAARKAREKAHAATPGRGILRILHVTH